MASQGGQATRGKEDDATVDVKLRDEADRQKLQDLIGVERHAVQRDRLRAALLACEGNQAQEIAATLGRSRRFVQSWAYAYRDCGVEAVKPRGKSSGRPPK